LATFSFSSMKNSSLEFCERFSLRIGKGRSRGCGAKARGEFCLEMGKAVYIEDYSRAGAGVSLPGGKSVAMVRNLIVLMAAAGLAAGAVAQYPGRVAKTGKPDPVLRSVAVLEWVGEPGKPSASRLVPVAVYDGEQLNDGTIYMSRPEPLAVAGGVEYELQETGKPIGIFDVFGAGEENGAWRGFGTWKPLSAAEVAKAQGAYNQSSLAAPVDVPEDDHPVLKRKHPKGTDTDEDSGKSAGAGSGSASGSGSSGDTAAKKTPAEPVDPDRPTLKRKTGDDSGTGSKDDSSAASSAGTSKESANADPDRPTIRRNRRASDDGMGPSSAAPDPDRPRLKRGKPADIVSETPKLEGFPPSMQQAVAVSDARTKAEHPWKYTWANPEDETKMKTALEAMARTALGLDAPAPKTVRKAAAGAPVHRPVKTPAPVEPVALEEEQFRVFELAYGASATMVLTASSPNPVAKPAPVVDSKADDRPVIKYGKSNPTGTLDTKAAIAPSKPAPQKFVMLIAQPDLYGGVLVLYKSVTDTAHLDERPRMRLIDAVDAMGDNRGELLFELRDTPKAQHKFREKYNLPYPLLADVDEIVCNQFGVLKEKNMYGKKVIGIARTTFVIGPDQTLLQIFPNVKPEGHAEEVLAAIEAHKPHKS